MVLIKPEKDPEQTKGMHMFKKHSKDGYTTVAEGIEMKTLVHGQNTLMTRFQLKKGSTLPSHSHPHEQTGFLVSGHLVLHIGDEAFDVLPGDSWTIPGDVPHRAEVLEDTQAVEVFSPVREDYLPRDPAGGTS
jgi:quercetin dioxygenase-like cupin family protein